MCDNFSFCLSKKRGQVQGVVSYYSADKKRHQKWFGVSDKHALKGKRSQKAFGEWCIEETKRWLEGKDDIPKSSQESKDPTRNTAPDGLMVTDYFQTYLENRTDLALTTIGGYESQLKTHILPYFSEHNMPLSDLTVRDINHYFSYLLTKVKGQTVRKHRAFLRKMLGDAVREGLIRENPVVNSQLPKVQNSPRRPIYTSEQTITLLQLLRDHDDPIYYIVLFSAFTGTRPSEALGLQWDMVFGNEIEVLRTVTNATVHGRYQEIRSDTTKTKNSHRTIPMPEILVKELERYRQIQRDWQAKYKRGYQGDPENGPVFVKLDGSRISGNYFGGHLKRFLKKHGLPYITPCGFRTSCATLLAQNGIPVTSIQAMFGHASIQTTQRYIQAGKTEKVQCKMVLEKVYKED